MSDIDGPRPDLEQLEQVTDTEFVSVPVRHEGPITTQELPARIGTVSTVPLPSFPVCATGRDLKRKRAVLISDKAWYITHSLAANSGGLWPANVPCEIHHCGVIYAYATAVDAVLTVITEYWAE